MAWKVPSQGMPSADAAEQHADALLHLARGLVGEGHRQDLRGVGEAGGDEVGDAGGEHARLAGAGAGQHQHGAVGGLDGAALLRVEAGQIGRGAATAARARAAMPPGRGVNSSSRRNGSVTVRGFRECGSGRGALTKSIRPPGTSALRLQGGSTAGASNRCAPRSLHMDRKRPKSSRSGCEAT